jgi:hypothetical protein
VTAVTLQESEVMLGQGNQAEVLVSDSVQKGPEEISEPDITEMGVQSAAATFDTVEQYQVWLETIQDL